MDLTWAFQLLLAVGSLVIDRQLELDPEREADGIFAHQFGRNRRAEEVRNGGESGAEGADTIRRARMVAVPPGGPVTLGFIYLIPVSMFIPFIRRRTIDLGRENELDTDDYYDGDDDMTADGAEGDGPEADQVVDGATSALRDAQNGFEEIPTGTAISTSAPVPAMSSPPPLSTSARELDHVSRNVQSGRSGRDESSRGSSVDIDYATSGDAAASARRTPGPFPSPSPSAADVRSSAAYAELFDELHREQLALIDLYFHFFQVETDECKLRMICEMAASPEKFYPLSDIFLHETKPKIRAPRTPVRSRFQRFHEAARRGFNGGTCATPSSDVAVAARRERRGSRPTNKDERRLCRRSAEDVVEMERLWILRELGRRVNLEFAPFT